MNDRSNDKRTKGQGRHELPELCFEEMGGWFGSGDKDYRLSLLEGQTYLIQEAELGLRPSDSQGRFPDVIVSRSQASVFGS